MAGDTAAALPGWRSAAQEAFPEPPAATYVPITVRNGGRVRIEVELVGPPPAPRALPRPDAAQPCGPTVHQRAAEAALERDGSHLANVVVWLADIRSGKRLPLERRFELTNVACHLEPRVQAVVAGGTMNVRSADAISHRTHFRRSRTGESLALIGLDDPGSVVPVEQVLARPSLIEVRCEVHPWMIAWIAVFDHPYFGVTTRGGTASLEDVPPGRYQLLAWHDRLGLAERQILVEAGRVTNVEIGFRATAIGPR